MEQLFAACLSATQSLLQEKKKNEMCQFLGLKLLLSQACSAKEIFSFSCSDLEWKTSFKLKQKSASGFCFPPNVSKTICSASTCSYFSADLWHPQMQTKQLPVCSARSLWDGGPHSAKHEHSHFPSPTHAAPKSPLFALATQVNGSLNVIVFSVEVITKQPTAIFYYYYQYFTFF